MVNVWDTDAWRLKSKTAKENRDKSQSGKHTAGSRSFLHTKIVMEKKKGRKVKLVELHTAVHTKKGTKPGEPGSSEIPEFVDPMSKQRLDEYSKIISEKHKENEENTEIDENGSKSPPDDFEVWKGVDTSNKGHVLGAGFTTDPAFVLTGYLDLMHGNLKQKTPRVLYNVICEILDGANIYLKHTSKHLLDVDRFHPRLLRHGIDLLAAERRSSVIYGSKSLLALPLQIISNME
ncbi:transposase, Ptta/En/Spm [Tanacetum coccineum]